MGHNLFRLHRLNRNRHGARRPETTGVDRNGLSKRGPRLAPRETASVRKRVGSMGRGNASFKTRSHRVRRVSMVPGLLDQLGASRSMGATRTPSRLEADRFGTPCVVRSSNDSTQCAANSTAMPLRVTLCCVAVGHEQAMSILLQQTRPQLRRYLCWAPTQSERDDLEQTLISALWRAITECPPTLLQNCWHSGNSGSRSVLKD